MYWYNTVVKTATLWAYVELRANDVSEARAKLRALVKANVTIGLPQRMEMEDLNSRNQYRS
jgi:hypothetical protein